MLRVVLGLAAVSAVMGCLTPEQMAHTMYAGADKDLDGVLHLTEMIDFFQFYDTNKDGRVSRHEYTEHLIEQDPTLADLAHALYDLYDVTGDHHLEMDDYILFYRRIDTDGDDSVSEAEYKVYWTHRFNELHIHHASICAPTAAL